MGRAKGKEEDDLFYFFGNKKPETTHIDRHLQKLQRFFNFKLFANILSIYHINSLCKLRNDSSKCIIKILRTPNLQNIVIIKVNRENSENKHNTGRHIKMCKFFLFVLINSL